MSNLPKNRATLMAEIIENRIEKGIAWHHLLSFSIKQIDILLSDREIKAEIANSRIERKKQNRDFFYHG